MNTTTTETHTYTALVGIASDAVGRMVYVGDDAELDNVARIRWFAAPITVQAETVTHAMSKIFEEANIGEEGWAAGYRGARFRSLSGGDFIKIHKADDILIDAVYQVTSFSFQPVHLLGDVVQEVIR